MSCAEHGAVASASPRDGSWQLQVHLLIARRAARSDLTVRSDRAHASRSNGEGCDVRFFTCARPEGACVHRCDVRGRTDGIGIGRAACARRDLRIFVTYSQIFTVLGLRLLSCALWDGSVRLLTSRYMIPDPVYMPRIVYNLS